MRGWYIYIEGTFLDKKLSLSCGQGPRRITRGHFHYAPSPPTLLGWKRAGKQGRDAERYFPYARAGKCVGSWSLAIRTWLERGGFGRISKEEGGRWIERKDSIV